MAFKFFFKNHRLFKSVFSSLHHPDNITAVGKNDKKAEYN
tara:strand:- start:151 stop:270 length:120 start_codon:yes stop_codon:yes gene_type:complete